METFYDSGLVIGAGGAPAIPIEGAVVVLVENGKRTYYDLSAVIDTIVTSCGRFMLDQSEIQDVPAAVAAAAGDPQERA